MQNRNERGAERSGWIGPPDDLSVSYLLFCKVVVAVPGLAWGYTYQGTLVG